MEEWIIKSGVEMAGKRTTIQASICYLLDWAIAWSTPLISLPLA
ncbi:hypothetical protein CUMW_022000 [Citrus unshiu]|uniref:Uncharacterized protein n=1 Tax=Citrus sinensis TaxID=2711 RepID=A0A067DEI4_CITSI|nr:hypothetical protein CISIN_1g038922mg [Citrus sinensis]GAY36426.1 hypothetical protein CUMW_022000 [Citrus unshiu]